MTLLMRSIVLASMLSILPGAAFTWEVSVEFGVLTCAVATPNSPSASVVPNLGGQGRDVVCRFRAGSAAPEETYVGTLQYIGQVRELFDNRTIILVVRAPVTTKANPGLLNQEYAVDANTGGGSQAPLVGHRNSLIVLQPVTGRSDQPSLALGHPPPGVIIIIDLRLASSPA
jgi:Protein of unknown function (DUF992)